MTAMSAAAPEIATGRARFASTERSSLYPMIVGAFVGSGEDIFWYQAGSAPERLFSMPG